MSDVQPKSRLLWLEDQLAQLQAWSRELRALDPARFRQEIEKIEAHRNWLETQIDRLTLTQAGRVDPA